MNNEKIHDLYRVHVIRVWNKYKKNVTGLKITAGQRTMTGQNKQLTGQTSFESLGMSRQKWFERSSCPAIDWLLFWALWYAYQRYSYSDSPLFLRPMFFVFGLFYEQP